MNYNVIEFFPKNKKLQINYQISSSYNGRGSIHFQFVGSNIINYQPLSTILLLWSIYEYFQPGTGPN